MHVVYFLVPLLPGPHVEVVKTPLPERTMLRRGHFVPQAPLSRRRTLPPPSAVHRAGNALLQHLHHRRRSSHPGLADQQMNVLQHHDVAQQREIPSVPNFVQNHKKLITRSFRPQQRPAPVATARDEVQVAHSVAPFQTVLHSTTPRNDAFQNIIRILSIHPRINRLHPRSFKLEITFNGCRIPSFSRRVREKALPISGYDSPCVRVSDSLVMRSMAPAAPDSVRTRPAPVAQVSRAPFPNRRVAAPDSGRVRRIATSGVVLSLRGATSLPQIAPVETGSNGMNEPRVELTKWYHPAASPVKRRK